MTDEHPAEVWNSPMGEDWTAVEFDVDALDQNRLDRYGVSRTELNQEFFDHLDRDIDICEIGCNTGVQLAALRELGFENLYGIDIQSYAVEHARRLYPDFAFVRGNALSLPFVDDAFDIVFTSGLLIHVPPNEIGTALREIERCSKQYVCGREYYADEFTEIEWRGRYNLLWKADYAGLYEEYCNLTTVHSRRLPYVDSDNQDEMFLLSTDH